MAEKVDAYLGFCLRARKIALGSGTIDMMKKGVYLLLVCSTASENTLKVAEKYSRRFSCPLVMCYSGLENSVRKAGCKLAAVRDENLAKAMVENLGGNYRLYAGRQ